MNAPLSDTDASVEALDREIAGIREESKAKIPIWHLCQSITHSATVSKLTRRRRFLSSSLLSSDYVRRRIEQRRNARSVPPHTDTDPSTLVARAAKHRDSNYHRVAFSTTTFPFRDPSPHTESPDLLGVRIDISTGEGRFVKPYYVLLRRVRDSSSENTSPRQQRLAVHQHTIPEFVPLTKLAQRYLPLPRRSAHTEDDEVVSKPSPKQDLVGFVRHLRRELVAWHMRRDSIEWLRRHMGLSDVDETNDRDTQSGSSHSRIVALGPASLEARYVRVEWRDGRVGRFKISNSGLVERAVVIGDRGRDKKTEAILTGGDGRIETLHERLLNT